MKTISEGNENFWKNLKQYFCGVVESKLSNQLSSRSFEPRSVSIIYYCWKIHCIWTLTTELRLTGMLVLLYREPSVEILVNVKERSLKFYQIILCDANVTFNIRMLKNAICFKVYSKKFFDSIVCFVLLTSMFLFFKCTRLFVWNWQR